MAERQAAPPQRLYRLQMCDCGMWQEAGTRGSHLELSRWRCCCGAVVVALLLWRTSPSASVTGGPVASANKSPIAGPGADGSSAAAVSERTASSSLKFAARTVGVPAKNNHDHNHSHHDGMGGSSAYLGDYLGGKCTEQRVAVEDVQNVAERGGLSIWGTPCHHASPYTSS